MSDNGRDDEGRNLDARQAADRCILWLVLGISSSANAWLALPWASGHPPRP